MKNILLFFLILNSSSLLFGQSNGLINEDRQGESFNNNTDYKVREIDNLLLLGSIHGHKSLFLKKDSLIQININGKRSIKIHDINFSSIKFNKNTTNEYEIIIKCKREVKCMVADWGNYTDFGFDVTSKIYAEKITTKLRDLLTSFDFNN